MEINQTHTGRPSLFIGSSSEGKALAEAIQFNLCSDIEAMVWNQGLVRLGDTMVESLDRISREVDFAALVVTPDDITETRGTRRAAARDNVLFEAGLFMGRLGRDRTFLVCPGDHEVGLPSDLAGMTFAPYSKGANGSLRASLGPACILIKEAIARSRANTDIQASSDASSSLSPSAPDGPRIHVPRPRRCHSLGTAIPFGPKQELRIVNISVTGAFLQTRGRLPIGQLLDLDLRLDDGAVVTLTASVVRVQEPDWGRIGGVGVKFTQVPPPSRALLEAFVESDRPAA